MNQGSVIVYYGNGKGKSSSNKNNEQNHKRVRYSENDKYKVASYYLRNNVSLIEVEKHVLGLLDNHGARAKNILNKLGIDTTKNSPHKGLLVNNDIDTAISQATGKVKETLEEIKKRNL